MTETEKVILYTKVLDAWGYEAQEKMVHEEIGELLSALGKISRGRATPMEVITELADVSIMIEQMAVYFGLDDFKAEKEYKLQRLAKRYKEWKEKHEQEELRQEI